MILGDKDAQLQNKIDQIRRLEQDIAQVKTESLQFCESPSNNSAHNWSYRSRGSDKASSQGRIDDYSDGDFKVDLPSYGCVLKGSR